jgi:hypothetical protein
MHTHGDVADAGPRVEPGAKSVKRSIVRGHRAPGEAEGGPEELAALVAYGYCSENRSVNPRNHGLLVKSRRDGIEAPKSEHPLAGFEMRRKTKPTRAAPS